MDKDILWQAFYAGFRRKDNSAIRIFGLKPDLGCLSPIIGLG